MSINKEQDLLKRNAELEKELASKNRELEIEASLERVRARTMAMYRSTELAETASVLFQQIKELGFETWSCGFCIWTKNDLAEVWMAADSGGLLPPMMIPYKEELTHAEIYEASLRGELVHDKVWEGKELEKHYAFLKTIPSVKEAIEILEKSGLSLPSRQCYYVGFFKQGYLLLITKEPNSELKELSKRFASVFDLTYTRFLDLQKAEAQAREAQIEAALERVRAKVMAMTNSKDLNETSLVFGEQLRKLGIDWQFSYFWLVDESKNENTFWVTWPDYKTSFTSYTLAEAEAYFNECLISWRAGVKIHDNYVPPQGVKEWIDTFQRIADDAGGEAKKIMVPQTFASGVYYYDAMMKYGSFGICINKAATDQEKKIQCRFAIEFERAYTRFLDLKQAEAQAREAQIELGLERVRARAMAMQKSDELAELVDTVFKELTKLHFTLDRCVIIIIDEKSQSANYWMANPESRTPTSYHLQLKDIPYLIATFEAWKERKTRMVYDLKGNEKASTVKYIFSKTELSLLPDQVKEGMKSTNRIFLNSSFNNFGGLQADTLEPLTEDDLDILRRFSRVFDLTYTRFNDLKQAEAQAREARIETALEKVRASTMAMQRSEDLSKTAFVLFNQFKELGEAPERIFIATFDDHDSGLIDLWGTDQGGSQLNKLFRLPVNEPTMVIKIVAAWREKKRSLVVDLQGEELQTYLGFLKQAGIPVTDGIMPNRRVQTVGCFSNGVIGVTTSEPQSSESVQLLERFAGVFDLTYTRFLDLQKAETQAREAKIETALERVRARALAMQAPEELKDVAQVLRIEMGLLGVEELETSSIYIHSDNSEMAECWYALKDPKETEKRMVADHIQLDLRDTWVGREMQKFYTSNKHQSSIVMQGAHRKEWIEYCYKHSPVFSGFYGETIPDRTYHLYKFSHGYIGAAAPGEISNESWRLLSRAASVFSLAYSRFRDLSQARIDLIKLKEEKKKAEDALTELQVTQKQLIQAEKMASLGELTAGIAHEIQNPLNFVNNFSDVSNELLEEMKVELEKGNAEAAQAIAVDVKENLEKILHHGKRADAIVKGMLQHSRNSSGQKELTDINVLAEEYLRLAYHGLRAKDKFFNAKFETDLDPSINKINIVPQEIGRVILNLINNSFYAVSEKKKNAGNGYEPIVTVRTKVIKPPSGDLSAGQAGLGVVEIRVKDNGNGIPPKLLDKIFQPFFTTKPTGQGTGLGLSLSYDIITKGHDGDIKVETKEGEGSEFIISLPVN